MISRRMCVGAVGFLVFCGASAITGAYVARSPRFEDFALDYGLRKQPARAARAETQSLANQSKPIVRPCPTDALVIVAAGQSNAGNHGTGRFVAPSNVVNFYAGHCYAARDPLLGATGAGGSIWGRLGARLNRPVVIAPVAVGSSPILSWEPGGVLHANLIATIRDLEAAHLAPAVIAWQQGEADLFTPPEEYASDFAALIRSVHHETPARFIVALSTRCKRPPSVAIRGALVKGARSAGGEIGPDTDTLGEEYRQDGCHFNAKGLDAAAALWASRIGQGADGN